jgi:predicted CXXCH cytochrome family protein
VLRVPRSDRSFDVACAGCHLNGFELAGDATSGFRASAVTTPLGAFDYDLDGRLEEMGIGCESCHGPGSEHLEVRGEGAAIVSPGLLTAERESALCGRCHARAEGHLAGSLAPLDASRRMPRPGLRRSELLSEHHVGPEVTAADRFPSGDPRRDRLGYVMHLSSTMFRNGSVLTTCTDCHDAHGSPVGAPHALRFDPTTNDGCTGCHGDDVYRDARMHVTAATGEDHAGVEDDDLHCVACHMPKVGTAGAMTLGLLDDRPATSTVVQYFLGDVASHRWRSADFDVAAEQPTSVTTLCAPCHVLTLPNP